MAQLKATTISGALTTSGPFAVSGLTISGAQDAYSIEIRDQADLTINTFNLISGAINNTFSGSVNITDTTASTSTVTGALKVSGGVGIGGSLFANNIYQGGNRVQTDFRVYKTFISTTNKLYLHENGLATNASYGAIRKENAKNMMYIILPYYDSGFYLKVRTGSSSETSIGYCSQVIVYQTQSASNNVSGTHDTMYNIVASINTSAAADNYTPISPTIKEIRTCVSAMQSSYSYYYLSLESCRVFVIPLRGSTN